MILSEKAGVIQVRDSAAAAITANENGAGRSRAVGIR
jgi:hypothetical protein